MTDARVTVVVSVKDRFAAGPAGLRALRSAAPGVPVIVVLSGPMGASTDAALRDEAARAPGLTLLDSGLDFANPFAPRNLALAKVATPFVFFLFNDVRPASPGWLDGLLAEADAHPEADVFQPFIWEGTGTPHAAWTDLYGLRSGARVRLVHPYDHAHKATRDPSRLPSAEQPFFLEDHAFLARTEFMKRAAILDPGCAYAKEYLDLALSIRYRGAIVRSVPSSQVLYQIDDPLVPEDLLHFAHRRSEALCAASIAHLRRKWGVDLANDGIGRHFFDGRLEGAAWSGPAVPADPLLQREMVLAWFVAAGYNRFAFEGETEENGLPALHSRFRETATQGCSLRLGRSTVPPEFPDFTPDYAQRREALREGRLFPLRDGAPGEIVAPDHGVEFLPFLILEMAEIEADERRVLEVLAPHAGLIVREPDGRCRAWFLVRHLPGEADAAERARRSAGVSEPPWVGGEAWPGARLRARGPEEPARLLLGPGSGTWRLLHWAWAPLSLSDLPRLFLNLDANS